MRKLEQRLRRLLAAVRQQVLAERAAAGGLSAAQAGQPVSPPPAVTPGEPPSPPGP